METILNEIIDYHHEIVIVRENCFELLDSLTEKVAHHWLKLTWRALIRNKPPNTIEYLHFLGVSIQLDESFSSDYNGEGGVVGLSSSSFQFSLNNFSSMSRIMISMLVVWLSGSSYLIWTLVTLLIWSVSPSCLRHINWSSPIHNFWGEWSSDLSNLTRSSLRTV